MGATSAKPEVEVVDEEVAAEKEGFITGTIGRSIADKLGYGEKSEFEGGLEECCPSLTWQQRLWGFGICFIFGMVLSYMSGFYIVRPAKFAILYTTGNLFAMGSTMFLMGPFSQLKRMFHPDRAIATVLYLTTMVLTVVVATRTGKVALVMPLIFLQWVALVWYSLSYIPFGQRILSSAVNFCCAGMCY